MSEKDPLLSNPADPVKVKTVTNTNRGVTIGESSTAINYSAPQFTGTAKGSSTLFISIFSCVLGTSFAFGYGLGCLNTSAKVIQNAYSDHFTVNGTQTIKSGEITLLWSFTVSAFCLGGMISGSIGGFIADSFGREPPTVEGVDLFNIYLMGEEGKIGDNAMVKFDNKRRSMLFMNIFHIIAVALMVSSKWTKVFEVIIVGRLVYGFFCGYATVICPLYLNEISPSSLRGSVGTVNQLVITMSLALGQVLGLPQLLGTEELFYFILGLSVVPAILHWFLMGWCPESPFWLYLFKKDKEGARIALQRLRGDSSSIETELEEFAHMEQESANEKKVSLKDMFTTYRRRPLLVAAVMHFSQQLGGVNAVIYYSTSIFEAANLSPSNAQYATIGLGAILIGMTFVSLVLIERLGRRTLHLHGLLGMFICLALLTASYLLEDVSGLSFMSYFCIVFVALYLAMFSVGPGAIPWFYTSEVFDHGSVKWAISIATFVNWLSNFTVGLVFPYMNTGMGKYAFMPFMVLIAIFGLYLYKTAPETKNKSTLQITGHFRSVHSIANLPAEERRLYQTFT